MKLNSKLFTLTTSLTALITLSFPTQAAERLKAEPISKVQLTQQAKVNLANIMSLSSLKLTTINKDAKALLEATPVIKANYKETLIASNHSLSN